MPRDASGYPSFLNAFIYLAYDPRQLQPYPLWETLLSCDASGLRGFAGSDIVLWPSPNAVFAWAAAVSAKENRRRRGMLDACVEVITGPLTVGELEANPLTILRTHACRRAREKQSEEDWSAAEGLAAAHPELIHQPAKWSWRGRADPGETMDTERQAAERKAVCAPPAALLRTFGTYDDWANSIAGWDQRTWKTSTRGIEALPYNFTHTHTDRGLPERAKRQPLPSGATPDDGDAHASTPLRWILSCPPGVGGAEETRSGEMRTSGKKGGGDSVVQVKRAAAPARTPSPTPRRCRTRPLPLQLWHTSCRSVAIYAFPRHHPPPPPLSALLSYIRLSRPGHTLSAPIRADEYAFGAPNPLWDAKASRPLPVC